MITGIPLETLRERIPDAAKDIRLNLQAVLQPSSLTAAQTWGVALAAAYAARNPELVAAVGQAARAAEVPDAVFEDAKAAAALMAMNNVYYRFRHFIAKPEYQAKPPRLRMNRLAAPATDKATLELISLAVSAVNGCELCVKAHEQAVRHGGLGDDQVHDAVRIAAVVHAAALALELELG
jgi:alkyl hydroperoxide reductase subunit D